MGAATSYYIRENIMFYISLIGLGERQLQLLLCIVYIYLMFTHLKHPIGKIRKRFLLLLLLFMLRLFLSKYVQPLPPIRSQWEYGIPNRWLLKHG